MQRGEVWTFFARGDSRRPSNHRVDRYSLVCRQCAVALLDGGEAFLEVAAGGKVDREAFGLEAKGLAPRRDSVPIGEDPWEVGAFEPPKNRLEQAGIDPIARRLYVGEIRARREPFDPPCRARIVAPHPASRGRVVEQLLRLSPQREIPKRRTRAEEIAVR